MVEEPVTHFIRDEISAENKNKKEKVRKKRKI